MDLTKLTQNEEIPIVVKTNFDAGSFVKGNHEYKSIWTPNIFEVLSTEGEPEILVDRYVVCVKREKEITGHLPLGKKLKVSENCVLFFEGRWIRFVQCFDKGETG